MAVKFLLTVILSILLKPAADPDSGLILTVKIENVHSGKGVLKVCIFDHRDQFFHSALDCIQVPADSNKNSLLVSFEGLKSGTYAAVVYQDFNQNGKLDRNWLGLPSEPYGFSRNPSTLFGPPAFDKAAFEMSINTRIIIKL